jgi:2-phosphosulfolactate phosphatase
MTNSATTNPHGQHQYQVRFDWGLAGAQDVAHGTDVVVWVDQLGEPQTELPKGLVIAGSIENAAVVATWVLERQAAVGERFRISVIAAGELRDDGSLRFAVEDLLGAGAVIGALAEVGIDACSPEAAAAASAWNGLRNSASHLISASASGRALGLTASALNPSSDVVVLREA